MTDSNGGVSLYAKLHAMTPAERVHLSVWLLSQAESNKIEGQDKTAEDLLWMAAVVRQFPVVPTREAVLGV